MYALRVLSRRFVPPPASSDPVRSRTRGSRRLFPERKVPESVRGVPAECPRGSSAYCRASAPSCLRPRFPRLRLPIRPAETGKSPICCFLPPRQDPGLRNPRTGAGLPRIPPPQGTVPCAGEARKSFFSETASYETPFRIANQRSSVLKFCGIFSRSLNLCVPACPSAKTKP